MTRVGQLKATRCAQSDAGGTSPSRAQLERFDDLIQWLILAILIHRTIAIHHGQGEHEKLSPFRRDDQPDPTTMAIDYLAANDQSHTGTRA